MSGQFNGLVAIWDIRRGTEPVDFSIMENSHRDPVNKVLWINSKSGTEFFSASTDGQCKWYILTQNTFDWGILKLFLGGIREN